MNENSKEEELNDYSEAFNRFIEKKLDESIADIENGRVMSSEEIIKEFEEYFGRKLLY